MVEKNNPNGLSISSFKWIIICLLLPLYSLLVWYLGNISNPNLMWSWMNFLINMGYCAVVILLISGFIDLVMWHYTLSKNHSKLMLSLLVGLSVYLLLQTAILVYEGVHDQMTLIITYALGFLASLLFILIHFFSNHYQVSHSNQPKPLSALLKTVHKGKAMHVSIDSICYISMVEKVIFIHLIDGAKVTINTSLGNLEQQLPAECFFRANRSSIVNKDCIDRSVRQPNNTLKVHFKNTSQTVIVSRSKVAEFNEWLQ